MGIPVRLQTIKSFRMRGRRGGNSIGFSLTRRIRSPHHRSILCCELRLRQNTGNYDASVALPQKSSMLTHCNNEDNFQTVTLEHFSARWNRANSTKRPLTKILRVFDRR